MRLRVLGSAAGGGFPQWNCGCTSCVAARAATGDAFPRTQESVAVTSDGLSWVLLNASPDIRTQLEGFPPLHPRAPRDSPVVAVLLTSGELDHTLGLLSLRESQPLVVYATAAVRDDLVDRNAAYGALAGSVRWEALPLGREIEILAPDATPTGLVVTALPVPGKVPRYLDGKRPPSLEDAVALRLDDRAGGGRLAYCPGAGRIDDGVHAALEGAAGVFFDGTFWAEDELVRSGLGTRTASEMAHVPIGGPSGSLARLRDLPASRRVLIHMNNTNPVLREHGPERHEVAASGWEVAFDGMELRL